MLARTSMEAERGWHAWLRAARDRLHDAGCPASCDTNSLASDILKSVQALS